VRKVGCLVWLVLIGVLSLETWLVLDLIQRFDDHPGEILIGLFGLSVIGYFLLRWRWKDMQRAVLEGRPGRAMAAIVGAVLVVLPGFGTGVLGLLMQLLPVQKLFAGLMAKLMRVLATRALKQMGAGGKGPFGGGGFPGGGMPPGGFKGGLGGMSGMKPDQRVGGKEKEKKGKTYDVEAEQVDDGE